MQERRAPHIGEALALYPKYIDLASGAVLVLHDKGDKFRTIGIDPGAIVMLAPLSISYAVSAT